MCPIEKVTDIHAL